MRPNSKDPAIAEWYFQLEILDRSLATLDTNWQAAAPNLENSRFASADPDADFVLTETSLALSDAREAVRALRLLSKRSGA